MDEATAASPVTASDIDLVGLLRTQPATGIAMLYDRYGRLVFSMALRVVQDRGAAEEITQDVFMRCWRNLDRYQPSQGSLVSWLLSITHNRAIDELRSRRGKDARREISDVDLQPQAVIDHVGYTVADFNRERAKADLIAMGVKNVRDGGPYSLHMDDPFGYDVQISGLENNALTDG